MVAQLKAEKRKDLNTISKLEHEVIRLKSDLTNLTKSVRMLNNGSDVLENILMTGRDAKDMSGLGYNETTKKRHHSNMNNFHSRP